MLDRECFDFQTNNLAALPNGARLLADGWPFNLEETSSRKSQVGRVTYKRITAADETGLTWYNGSAADWCSCP